LEKEKQLNLDLLAEIETLQQATPNQCTQVARRSLMPLGAIGSNGRSETQRTKGHWFQ